MLLIELLPLKGFSGVADCVSGTVTKILTGQSLFLFPFSSAQPMGVAMLQISTSYELRSLSIIPNLLARSSQLFLANT